MSEWNVTHSTGQGWTPVDLSATDAPTPEAPDPSAVPVMPDERAASSAEVPASAPEHASIEDPAPEESIPVARSRGERRLAQLQEQIADALARRRAVRDEETALAAAVEARRQELRALQGTVPPPVGEPGPAPIPAGKPQRSAYGEESSYLEAVAAWSGQVAAREALAQQEAERTAQLFQERHQVGEATYPDYREVVTNPDLEPVAFLQPVIMSFLKDSPASPHVLYYLGTHPEAFAEFQDLNPRGAARYLARLAQTVHASPGAEASPPAEASRTVQRRPLPATTTAGAPPIRPLSGNGTGPVQMNAADIANQHGSLEAYIKARRAEERQRTQ